MRLIDADDFDVITYKETESYSDCFDSGVLYMLDRIDAAPTVDAVEVVRCCKCKQHDHDGGAGYCNRWGKWSNMSDFCSYGERKEATE